jgi:uncharacterized protein involved in cysteine biosynthesis
MKTLVENLQSPTWWLSVIVIGLLLNLFASYLRSWIDNRWNRMRAERLARLKKDKEKFDSTVDFLAQDYSRILIGTSQVIRQRIEVLTWIVCSVLGIQLASIFLPNRDYLMLVSVGMVSLCGFISYLFWKDASESNRVVIASLDRAVERLSGYRAEAIKKKDTTQA